MKLFSSFLCAAFAFVSFQAFSQASWVPVKDKRIKFEMCGTDQGTSGIGSPKVTYVCTGTVDGTKNGVVIVVFPGKKPAYLGIAKEKLIRAVGDQEGGLRDWSLELVLLDKDLEKVSNSPRSAAKMHQEWEYSDGSMTITGKIPGTDKDFSASLVDASDEHPDRE